MGASDQALAAGGVWLSRALGRLDRAKSDSTKDGTRMDVWRVAPVLVVSNVEESANYYRECLGFEVVGTFGEPLEMAFVGRGGTQIMLQDAEGRPIPGPNSAYKSVAWDALFWVRGVRELHEELRARGAQIRREPYETFYGHLELEVADPDGHVLCFGQPR
jgi:uncharacterized glyoxalase superfamily protein PhnB